MCQVFCDVKIEITVSRNVFQPKPDVDSAVLSFYPKDIDLPDPKLFSSFIQQSFSQRRKKLKNNLPESHKAGVLQKWADLRPEEISPSEFAHIFERIIFDTEQN
jgi:16S rRNA (adenine1518-N6/adenine1519-N6)-dimethyltransferase